MAGTIRDGGCAVIPTCPMTLWGARSSLFMIDTDGSCPVLNVSCRLPPAAPRQSRIAGFAPSDGGDVWNTPGGPVGTYGEDPPACHGARAAPWRNARPTGPLAV